MIYTSKPVENKICPAEGGCGKVGRWLLSQKGEKYHVVRVWQVEEAVWHFEWTFVFKSSFRIKYFQRHCVKLWQYLIIFKKSNNYISRRWEEYLLYTLLQSPLQDPSESWLKLVSKLQLCDASGSFVSTLWAQRRLPGFVPGVPPRCRSNISNFSNSDAARRFPLLSHTLLANYIQHSITDFKGIVLIKHISPLPCWIHTRSDDTRQ